MSIHYLYWRGRKRIRIRRAERKNQYIKVWGGKKPGYGMWCSLGESVIVAGWEELEFSEGPDMSHVPNYRKGTEVSSVGTKWPESMGGHVDFPKKTWNIVNKRSRKWILFRWGKTHPVHYFSSPWRSRRTAQLLLWTNTSWPLWTLYIFQFAVVAI